MSKRKQSISRRRLELVLWSDPTSQSKWMGDADVDEFMVDDTFTVHSVGWVVRENDDAIALAATVNHTDEFVGQIFRIPKATIVKRLRLKQS